MTTKKYKKLENQVIEYLKIKEAGIEDDTFVAFKSLKNFVYKHNLKICPMCGNKKSLYIHKDSNGVDTNYAVRCDFNFGGCGTTGGYRNTEIKAIKLWNKRLEIINTIITTSVCENPTVGIGSIFEFVGNQSILETGWLYDFNIGERFILSLIGLNTEVALISLKTGIYYNEGYSVENVDKITFDEMEEIFGCISRFKKINKGDN